MRRVGVGGTVSTIRSLVLTTMLVALATAVPFNGAHAQTCFASDPGAGSPNRADHSAWAQTQSGPHLAANVKWKIEQLAACPILSDDAFANAFADLSTILATYVRNTSCFSTDPGAKSTDRAAHYRFAKSQGRPQLLQNFLWKVDTAWPCLNLAGQRNLFASLSGPVGQAGNPGAPPPLVSSGEKGRSWYVMERTRLPPNPAHGVDRRSEWIVVVEPGPASVR